MKLLKDKTLFWEANLDTIDAEKNKQYIIERVFERGTSKNIKELLYFYDINTIKQAIKQARWFDAKTMYFLSVYFDIPLEQMRCYTQRQLSPAPWA
ncbi:MAG: hypothetical protein JSR11_01305 [Bacteroidetes bacterium]|nr:hypothetical protein [Bacteroidota bacterium]